MHAGAGLGERPRGLWTKPLHTQDTRWQQRNTQLEANRSQREAEQTEMQGGSWLFTSDSLAGPQPSLISALIFISTTLHGCYTMSTCGKVLQTASVCVSTSWCKKNPVSGTERYSKYCMWLFWFVLFLITRVHSLVLFMTGWDFYRQAKQNLFKSINIVVIHGTIPQRVFFLKQGLTVVRRKRSGLLLSRPSTHTVPAGNCW